MKKSLLQKLDLYGYNYTESENKIVIKLDFSQEVSIDFSVPNKVAITDRLTGSNLLSGMVKIKLKYALIYTNVILLIFTIFFLWRPYSSKPFFLIGLIIVAAAFKLMCFLYYTIKLESMKSRICFWLK